MLKKRGKKYEDIDEDTDRNTDGDDAGFIIAWNKEFTGGDIQMRFKNESGKWDHKFVIIDNYVYFQEFDVRDPNKQPTRDF